MALERNTVAGPVNTNPFEHVLTKGEFRGDEVAGDRYAVEYHVFAHSHLDGPPHSLHYGKMYNGRVGSCANPRPRTSLNL